MPRLMLLMLCIVSASGCGRDEPSRPSASSSPAIVSPPPPPPPAVTNPSAPPAATSDAGNATPPPQTATNGSATPPVSPGSPSIADTVQNKAAVGAGAKGRGYGVGPIVTPIASYFAMRERLAYDIQIPEAMKLFKATEDRVPKSHDEFMQRIIKDNHITLPLLPEGQRYLYDPQRGELMVEQPAP